jgi:hypothetical protein
MRGQKVLRPMGKSLPSNEILGVTAFALILQSTDENVDEYRRIGMAEIPVDDGMADGWDTKIVTIV